MHLVFLCAVTLSIAGGDGDADKAIVEQIVSGIERASSLYAKFDAPTKVKNPAQYAAAKLARYDLDKDDSMALNRVRWIANKEKYALIFPLRAGVFSAQDLTAEVDKLPVSRSFVIAEKAELIKRQQAIGLAIFKIDEILLTMKSADEQRETEKSPRWRAEFDFAYAQTLANQVFLFEHNMAIAQIRTDNLPDLSPEHDGWMLFSRAKMLENDRRPREHAKTRLKLLERIQKDHPETPWAYYANREVMRDLGLAWVPRKK